MIAKWEWALLGIVGIPIGGFFGALVGGGLSDYPGELPALYDAFVGAIVGALVGLTLGLLAGYALWHTKPRAERSERRVE
jgi:hypothetical protein